MCRHPRDRKATGNLDVAFSRGQPQPYRTAPTVVYCGGEDEPESLEPAACALGAQLHILDGLDHSGAFVEVDCVMPLALAHLRAGDPEPYLAHAARRGRLSVNDDTMAAKERLLGDWWRDVVVELCRLRPIFWARSGPGWAGRTIFRRRC